MVMVMVMGLGGRSGEDTPRSSARLSCVKCVGMKRDSYAYIRLLVSGEARRVAPVLAAWVRCGTVRCI